MGEAYLEKIIQLPINVPEMNGEDLQQYLFENLNEFCNNLDDSEFDTERWGCIYRNGYGEYFKTFRDVNRYINSIQFKVESYKKVINIVDLFAMEAIALFEPKLLNLIFEYKDLLCGNKILGDKQNEIKDFKSRVGEVSQNYKMLLCLFPKITENNSIFYEGMNFYQLKAHGRICDIGNLEYYFAGQLHNNGISKEIVRKVLYENTSKQNEQYFNNLTNKAYNLFLQFLYGFSKEAKNVTKIVEFIPELLKYNPSFKDLTNFFVMRNSSWVNWIIENVIEFSGKDKGITFLKTLYEHSNDYEVLIDNIYNNADGTGYYSHSKKGESKYTVEEINEFHSILISRLSKKMYEEDFLALSNIIQILAFTKEKNIDLLKSWYETQKDSLLKLIEKLVNIGYGESSTRFRTYYFYHDVFDEFVDIKQVQEEVKQFLIEKPKDYPSESVIGKILFLMPFRKNDPYTLAEIKSFCVENKIEFSYTDNFIDE